MDVIWVRDMLKLCTSGKVVMIMLSLHSTLTQMDTANQRRTAHLDRHIGDVVERLDRLERSDTKRDRQAADCVLFFGVFLHVFGLLGAFCHTNST